MKIDTNIIREILQDLRKRFLRREIDEVKYQEQLNLLVNCSLNKVF